MDKVVLVDIKNVYGRRVIYPANEIAECLAAIADTVTLTPRTLRYAVQMGFEIKMAEQEVENLAALLGFPR